MKNYHQSSSHAVYSIRLHIIFVTKYRRPFLSKAMLSFLETCINDVLLAYNSKLIQFEGEPDHIHFIADINPNVNISVLMNNLKTASSRRCGLAFAEEIKAFFKVKAFWHRAYFVASIGGAPLETLKKYVENQGKGKSKPLP